VQPCDLYLLDSSMADDDNVELRCQVRAAPFGDPLFFFSAVSLDADKHRRT
jgi:hypothetical protein